MKSVKSSCKLDLKSMSANKTISVKRYRIPMNEEVSKGRMHLIPDKLDALIYFYPEGKYVFVYLQLIFYLLFTISMYI